MYTIKNIIVGLCPRGDLFWIGACGADGRLVGESVDKKRSILNVAVSVGFKVMTTVMVIFVKRILIQTCGNEVNGLNALYLSIVGFLSVAELGVGSAITFCMYKPIVEGDKPKVAALYNLFRRVYIVIGSLILAAGLAISPFIRYLAADYAVLDVNFRITFVLMLISVVVTYYFGAKTALINAYKNNYITTAITSGGILLQYVLQIITLLLTGSFTGYLVCRIVAVAVQWGITEVVARKKYSSLMSMREKVDEDTRKELTKNIKAMFMHKIGTLLVTTADSIIISVFVGVVVLGKYSNYATIMTAMMEVLKLVFSSLTSVFGHLYVEKNKETARKYCEIFHLLNFIIGIVFFLGYYAVIDHLIALLFAPDLVAERAIALVVTANGFVQFMRSSVLAFKDATGSFYYDRWKPLAEGIVNIVLSVLFVRWIGVTGVIVATVITNLVICHVVEPYVLYRHAFEASPKGYCLRNYGMILVFFAMLMVLDGCLQSYEQQWVSFLVNGCISVGFSGAVSLAVLLCSKNLRGLVWKKKQR